MKTFRQISCVAVRGALVVALGVLAAVAQSREPWTLSPEEWSAADIRKILDNSPWCKFTFIEAHWVKPGSEGMETSTTIQMDRGRDARPSNPTDVLDRRKPVRHYAIRWVSAATVREALERERVAQPLRLPGDVVRALRDPDPDSILIVIHGDDMTPFRNTDAGALKASTWLRPRRHGGKVAPARVEIVETGRQSGGIVLLYFPRWLESGEMLVEPAERQVDFECQAWQATFTMRFDPRRMHSAKGSDL